MNFSRFFAELKRRNVYRVAVAYAVVGWLVIQVAATIVPALHLPAAITTAVVVLVLLGFPIALVIAWAFELTPEGIKRSEEVARDDSVAPRSGRKLLITIAVVGALALGLLLFQLTRPKPVASAPVAVAPAVEGVTSKSIAVLPFQNLSKDEENAFFADGVQDEILTTLAKVADLKVISRTSVMQYKNTERRNLPEIAHALKVAHVLEGSVQRSASRVRVTAQLIDAQTDAHLWAERYDRELADVFAIQTEIAQKIAEQLRAVLSPQEKAAIEAKPTADLVAYDLYLRAKEISLKAANRTEATLREPIKLLDEAVARDPAFVPALCLLARTHLELYQFAFDQTPARLELAKKALEAAARLQPDAGDVHLARGMFYYAGKLDYPAALAEFELARSALPNEAKVIQSIAAVARRMGRWEDATRHFQVAGAMDPRNPVTQVELAQTYSFQRRYAEAARTYDDLLAWKPDEFVFQRFRAGVDVAERADHRRLQSVLTSEAAKTAPPEMLARVRYEIALWQGDYRTAEEALSVPGWEETSMTGYAPPREWDVGLVASARGDAEKARTAFLAAREKAAADVAARPQDAKARMILARIEARLGNKDAAIREGERALAELPTAKDALEGVRALGQLAAVYADLGESGRALDLLEQSAKLPAGLSYGSLMLNLSWETLRNEPRFQKILESLAPKVTPP